MNTSQAKRMTVASLFVTGTLVTVRDVSKGAVPSIRNALGLVFVGVTLSLLAEGAPQVAGALALLLMVSSIFSIGGEAFDRIGKAL